MDLFSFLLGSRVLKRVGFKYLEIFGLSCSSLPFIFECHFSSVRMLKFLMKRNSLKLNHFFFGNVAN